VVFLFITFKAVAVLMKQIYRAFHGFVQAKFPYGGSILGSSQFSIQWLPQLPPKILLNSKVVKIGPKIIISLC